MAFVGRRRQLGLVAEALDAARLGRRQLIAVRGEAGVGKTSFAGELSALAEAQGFTVVWGRCWAHGGAPPLWPWQPILSELLGPSSARLLDNDPGSAAVDPERFTRFAAVAERLAAALASRSVVVILDDLHNADAGALLLTRFLTRMLDRSRLVLTTLRRPALDEPAGAPVAALIDEVESEALLVELERFSLEETEALIASYGGQGADDHLAGTLQRVTGGSPLLLNRALAHGDSVHVAITDAVGALPRAPRRVVALAALLGNRAAIADVGTLAGDPAEFVVEAVDLAATFGLMSREGPRCRFAHDLVREAALTSLSPAEALDAHAAAAAMLAGEERGEARVRRARHALAAAARSDADAAVAVDAGKAAAAVMRHGFDDEGAAALLEACAEQAERLTPRPDWADLPIERAAAVRSCGRLADARTLYAQALEAPGVRGDPVRCATAAIGLGGLWLHEHRDPLEQQRVLDVQRRALDALSDEEVVLRGRLRLRLAAEEVYAGADPQSLRDELDLARAGGDALALAEGLSLAHHALLAPGGEAELLAMAEELVRVASGAGEAMFTLMGMMWRTVDLYQLGDRRARRSLEELRQRVDALRCRSIGYIVALIDVMRLIRAGRLDEAESAADAALALGTEVGDSDAIPYFAAQLLTIRFLQGREVELVEVAGSVATSVAVVPRERALRAAEALLTARAGRSSEASLILEELAADDLAALSPWSTSLAGLALMVEAAAELGDGALARRLYPALVPFAQLVVMPSLAVTCLGSVERSLGIAALTWGDRRLAAEHLERARRANIGLRHLPMAALSAAELAEAVAFEDPARAMALLADAVDEAESASMELLSRRWAQRAADLAARPAATSVELSRHGSQWLVVMGARRVEVPDLVGMAYLRELISRPGVDVPAVELCGARVLDGMHHELLDRSSLDLYRRRVAELDADIDDAESSYDLGRAERLRLEREALREQLSDALALGGRSRRFVDSAERARTAVHKAVKRAIDAVAERDRQLGEVLRHRVSTGVLCRYDLGSRQ
jgi:AAA ATPase domain